MEARGDWTPYNVTRAGWLRRVVRHDDEHSGSQLSSLLRTPGLLSFKKLCLKNTARTFGTEAFLRTRRRGRSRCSHTCSITTPGLKTSLAKIQLKQVEQRLKTISREREGRNGHYRCWNLCLGALSVTKGVTSNTLPAPENQHRENLGPTDLRTNHAAQCAWGVRSPGATPVNASANRGGSMHL